MEEKLIRVVSTVDCRVVVNSRDYQFRAVWPSKGSAVMIKSDMIANLLYTPGFGNLINEGTLYIPDMKIKQDLGLEPMDAQKPVNIIVLDDKKMKDLMVIATLNRFKQEVSKFHESQIQQLADFAIENRYADFEKCEVIKKLCGRDVIKTISLNAEG